FAVALGEVEQLQSGEGVVAKGVVEAAGAAEKDQVGDVKKCREASERVLRAAQLAQEQRKWRRGGGAQELTACGGVERLNARAETGERIGSAGDGGELGVGPQGAQPLHRG